VRWSASDLHHALDTLAAGQPAAATLQRLIAPADLYTTRKLGCTEWASRFDKVLSSAGFPGRKAQSDDAQRFVRWRELLDEFATLDAVIPPTDLAGALGQLRALAMRAVHEAASGDAAITLTAHRGDPLIHYDGIWVMGLTEQAWPEAPRPDPYIALSEQLRVNWPEASAALRRQQAQAELECWRARSRELVLSYAQQEGDLKRRASPILVALQPDLLLTTVAGPLPRVIAPTLPDQQMPAIQLHADEVREQRNGTQLLALQQQCAFRAQAQLRMGAEPLELPVDGIDSRMRGQLLHAVLEQVWRKIGDQATLRRLSVDQQRALIADGWQIALRKTLSRRGPIAVRVLARELHRTQALVLQALQLEAARPPFAVESTEQELPLQIERMSLTLRIDRIDVAQSGERLVVDYKSGNLDAINVEDELPRPVQLLAYFAALAQQETPVTAIALLGLKPAQLRFAGVSATPVWPRGIKCHEHWAALTQHWQGELARLMRAFLAGDARVAPMPGACKHCHLTLLCRVANAADTETDDA
jgi:ATP-dependent helicase/nuclease subunit B